MANMDSSRAAVTTGLILSLLFAGAIGACGTGNGPPSAAGAGASDGSANGGAGGDTFVGSGGAGGAMHSLDVQPSALQTIDVAIGEQTPTIEYSATMDGAPVNASWTVDRGNVGTIPVAPASSATFTPSGTTGGAVNVIASVGELSVEREIFVRLSGAQNGYDPTNPDQAAQVPGSVAELTEGGGVGGVGGEGLGPGVTDPATLDALDNPLSDGTAEALRFIYPYDGTVWPRGLPAPNLMWRWTLADADAVLIELETNTGSFSWSGTFGRPEILALTGGAFIRHPIPQDVWRMATNTAGGVDRITMRLTVALDGQGYGPIEQTWTIAPARMSGTIYYISYGTNLAKNHGGAVGGDGTFGGAVLSIRAGDAGPALAAGSDGGSAQCRVCHSVAANGSRFVAIWGTGPGSAYDVTPTAITETTLPNSSEFPGLSADGSMMLTLDGTLYPLPDSSTPLAASGLTQVSTSLGPPTFSPDTTRVAFNMLASGSITNPKQKLVVMDFNPSSFAFTNPVVVADYTGQPAEMRPGWPAFFPDGQSVIFHTQFAAGIDGNNLADLRTRKGARAEISWTHADNPNEVTRLDALNGRDAGGTSYLPELEAPIVMTCEADDEAVGQFDQSHENDVILNYEPTVNPVASGGYAWVVFTSRRLYGNVAEVPPFCSDPRGVDLIENITTKKLWVAAVDITGQPGSDASHPAFYLPGQELLAGNARGFWALDPCKDDGESCEAGDECCNGFCQPDREGNLVCSPPGSGCSGPQEACETAADCCDPDSLCVNGFCTVQPPS
jgi:hypothetical protein